MLWVLIQSYIQAKQQTLIKLALIDLCTNKIEMKCGIINYSRSSMIWSGFKPLVSNTNKLSASAKFGLIPLSS